HAHRGGRVQEVPEARPRRPERRGDPPAPEAAQVVVGAAGPHVWLDSGPEAAAAHDPGGRMNFDIKTEELGDSSYVISLAGEVDLYTAPEFKQQLLEVIGQGAKQV